MPPPCIFQPGSHIPAVQQLFPRRPAVRPLPGLQDLEAQLDSVRTELAEAQEMRGEVEALGDEGLLLEVEQTVAGLQVRGSQAHCSQAPAAHGCIESP